MRQAAAQGSASRMVDSIVSEFHPCRVVDVGCGSGELLLALQSRGCQSDGLDYATAALERCRARGLKANRFDLENDSLDVMMEYNLAASLEVAQHLPAQLADHFVDMLTRLAPVVVFTAAVPGQGGIDHVNEQPNTYWAARFAARGFVYDTALSEQWRSDWQSSGQVSTAYWKNLMIFSKKQSPAPQS